MADRSGKPPETFPRVHDGWIVGKLIDHGPARYQWADNASLSYFIRLQTRGIEQGVRRGNERHAQGARPIDGRNQRHPEFPHAGAIVTRWGGDLQRAIRESKSRVDIGQWIGAKIVSRELVDGRSAASPPRGQPTYWNRWEVETLKFIAQRARFARAVNQHYQKARRNGVAGNEAFALYLIHEGARRLAAQRYRRPDDQKAFTDRLWNFLQGSPDRAALIARTFERVNALKTAQTAALARPPADALSQGLRREPPTRE